MSDVPVDLAEYPTISEDATPAQPRRPTAGGLARLRATYAYDALTRAPLVCYFLFCGWVNISRLWHDVSSGSAFDAAQVLRTAAGLGMFGFLMMFAGALLVRMRPVARTAGAVPRLVALGGTFSVVTLGLFPRADLPLAVTGVALLLICAGYFFACYSLAHLGRSVSIMAEARRLVVTGPYAFVRHPLYVGEALASLGVLLQILSPLAVLVWLVHIALQMIRMHYEERLLRQTFPDYRQYAATVSRLIPGIY